MAVTKGHGNPAWTRDEVILALDLYLRCGDHIPGPGDERVQDLSRFLRSFPYHAEAARQDSFRNPDGVAFKLQNLKSVRTGQGLKNTSRVDREVWDEFGDDAARVAGMAALIRRSVEALGDLPQSDDAEEFPEGASATRAHVKRERAKGLRKAVIAERLKRGELACDICSSEAGTIAPALREAVFECHHIIPLNLIGESKTRVGDIALLCANCHRSLHKAIAANKRWYSIEEARRLFFDWQN